MLLPGTELLTPMPIPLPLPGPVGLPHPMAWAALSRADFQSPSTGVSPGTRVSPLAGRFIRRISTGSIPSRSAASLSCDSMAKHRWVAPKPRKAVFGGRVGEDASCRYVHVGHPVGTGTQKAGLLNDPGRNIGVGTHQRNRPLTS